MKTVPITLILLLALANASLVPSQIHLSWTEREDEMRVTWAVFPYSVTDSLKYREVDCSTDSPDWQTVSGNHTYFQHGDAFYQYIYVVSAIIPNIKPACNYEYKVGNSIIWSETFKFNGRSPFYKFPARQEDLDFVPKIAIFGDLGVGNWSVPTRDLLRDDLEVTDYQALIHLGDIGYDLDDNDGYLGNEFGELVQEFAAYTPYMLIPGNHEHADNFTHYINRFRMPQNWASQNSSFYYSFNIGRAHIVMYDTELFKYDKQPQIDRMLQWLNEDLIEANKNRDQVPWLIVMAHKPLYCGVDTRFPDDDKDHSNNDNCIGQANNTRFWVEDLLYKYKVDVIFGAHVHNYERDTAIYQNKSMPCKIDTFHYQHDCTAPVHILSGTAGNDHAHEQVTQTPQEWMRFGSEAYGYGKLIIYNSTTLYWEEYDSEKRVTIDYLWLTKDRPTY